MAAFLLRAAWVLYAHRPPAGLSDPALYQSFAENIAAGRGYVSLFGHPTAYYPPGYPYALGALQWLADSLGMHDALPLLAGVAQAALGGITAAAVASAAARMIAPAAAAWAGAIIACWPSLVLYSATLLSESLYLACFSVFLACEAAAMTRARTGAPQVAAAAALGAAALVRPQVVLAIPAAALAWLLARRRARTAASAVMALVLGVTIALTPWTLRNLRELGAFVPLATNGGDNMCIGFHPGATGDFHLSSYCDSEAFYVQGPQAELARDRETTRRALAWASENIAELPALSLRKLFFTYRNDTGGLAAVEAYGADPFLAPSVRTALTWISNGYYGLVMLAALAGAVLALRRAAARPSAEAGCWLLLAVTAASAAVPLLVFGDPRFKVPVAPCYAILAALAAHELRSRPLTPRRA
ncbi:MAG TPA: hypothetical protein VEC57_00805 [Candidatus Limnocylindrales bacterium]|nr:hypothetical protein [Candidatus Limnocylindrales bacterium]